MYMEKCTKCGMWSLVIFLTLRSARSLVYFCSHLRLNSYGNETCWITWVLCLDFGHASHLICSAFSQGLQLACLYNNGRFVLGFHGICDPSWSGNIDGSFQRGLWEGFQVIWLLVDEVDGGFMCLGEIPNGLPLLVGYETCNQCEMIT